VVDTTFLDTGVILGYTYTTDKHHDNCANYIEEVDYLLYVSDTVWNEYFGRSPTLAEQHSNAIFNHISELEDSDFEGQLDPLDIKTIRERVLDPDNNAYNYLYWFYQSEVSKYIPMDQLKKQLRELARGIETNAIKRRKTLEAEIEETWERDEKYEDLDDDLSSIPKDDREICIDAHDLAVEEGLVIELATTNPNDLVKNGHRSKILDNT
jgi:predicted nucleic acid-binding protein